MNAPRHDSSPPRPTSPPSTWVGTESTWVGRWVGHWVIFLGLLLGGIELGTRYLAIPWTIDGPSMEPALLAGDRVIVDVWSYRHRRPRIGEVALLVAPRGATELLVKRVAEGPNVDISRPGLWVEGDNRGRSRDSRAFGKVPAEAFRGRVILRYWPLSRAGRIR